MDGENRFSPIYHLHDDIDVVLDPWYTESVSGHRTVHPGLLQQ